MRKFYKLIKNNDFIHFIRIAPIKGKNYYVARFFKKENIILFNKNSWCSLEKSECIKESEIDYYINNLCNDQYYIDYTEKQYYCLKAKENNKTLNYTKGEEYLCSKITREFVTIKNNVGDKIVVSREDFE